MLLMNFYWEDWVRLGSSTQINIDESTFGQFLSELLRSPARTTEHIRDYW